MELTNPIVLSFFISMAIQVFFFAFAATLKTDKVTDLSYGLTFIFLALYWLLSSDAIDPLKILVTSMVVIWGARLAIYLLIRIIKTGRDNRFDDKRDNFVKFAQFWTLQGFGVWAIMIPSVYMLTRSEGLSITGFAVAGAAIWLIGLAIETIADMQLYRFRFQKKPTGKWIDEGLWHYSRHPNYFGEMLVWWGVFIVGLPLYQGLGWLTIAGPIFITILLRYVTGIPILEQKADKRWGDDEEYQQYKKSTNLIIVGPKRPIAKS